MAKGKDERHHPNRKVDRETFQAGDRVRHIWKQRHGEVHNYGTFATHAKEDPDGAYVQFDDPKKGPETYVAKSELSPLSKEHDPDYQSGWGEAVGKGLGVAAGGAIRPSEEHLDDSERLALRLDEAMRASGARPL